MIDRAIPVSFSRTANGKLRPSSQVLLGNKRLMESKAVMLNGLEPKALALQERSLGPQHPDVARTLASNAAIAEVLYPGLESHPAHDLAKRQMTGGFGGMLSIRVAGGEAAAVRTAAALKLWKRATSLGGVESLVEHRASVEGAGSPCPSDLLRLSVGLENPADLVADLQQALAQARNSG